MKTQSSVPKVKPVARAKRVTMFEMPPLPSLFTQPLGLEGWAAYEPVLIAALASGEPLLLIGAHGSAKSFLLERLAQSLGLEYRFYNASLINYDDLVGFPIPDEERKSLRYISTPSAIWDAQVVFFDEINRTRPELQNKLFPIIHERRVQGIKLDRLIYRWSAMNPPPSVDGMDDTQDIYLGAEPLDPALADRFAFLIEVPTWQHLTDVQKRAVFRDQFRGEHDFPVGPSAIVAAAQRHLALSPAFTSTRTLSSAIAVVTSICSC
jgi:MoxR-like ATPase